MTNPTMTVEDTDLFNELRRTDVRSHAVSRAEAKRILATYAECERLRAALTEAQSENARLTKRCADADFLIDFNKTEVAALRARVDDLDRDNARWSRFLLIECGTTDIEEAKAQLKEWRRKSGDFRFFDDDAARGPRTGGDGE